MNIKIPRGVQDFIGLECHNKIIIESKLAEVFESYGYERCQPTGLEYYTNFVGLNGHADECKMFKLNDTDGRIIVLNPDTTMQISRIAATKFLDSKLTKLFYIGNSYEADNTAQSARTREFSQGGIELIGGEGYECDVEAVTVALECFESLKVEDYYVDLGQVEFFYGLIESMGLDKAAVEHTRELLDKKDMLGLELHLRGLGVKKADIKLIEELTGLFGGKEVIAKAEKLVKNGKSERALCNLSDIYSALESRVGGKHIGLDLSMVKTSNYYSGLVFRGMTKSLGQCILDGGRYDGLSENFGVKNRAVGFAIGIKRLLVVLERQGKLIEPERQLVVLGAIDSQSASKAYKAAAQLRKKGAKVSVCQLFDRVAILSYAKCVNARRVLIYGSEVEEIENV